MLTLLYVLIIGLFTDTCYCEDGYFQCESCFCIPDSYKCDGDNDCGEGDLSDETNCTGKVHIQIASIHGKICYYVNKYLPL